MDTAQVVWSERYDIGTGLGKGEEQERIVVFIHDQLVGHSVELEKVGFIGAVYGLHHVSLRVPGVMELAVGALYEQRSDRYLSLSLQRLHLVDERAAGTDKLVDAFRAFGARLGLIGWYGETEFEITMLSS